MELTALAELLYSYTSRGKGKSVMPHNEEHSEPVMCSKCNILFSTEREYLQHYNQIHRMTESSSS
jgi:uncharacterized C2H2 Zn-finger protein